MKRSGMDILGTYLHALSVHATRRTRASFLKRYAAIYSAVKLRKLRNTKVEFELKTLLRAHNDYIVYGPKPWELDGYFHPQLTTVAHTRKPMKLRNTYQILRDIKES